MPIITYNKTNLYFRMNGLHALKEFMKTIADIVRNILSNVKDVIRHIVEKVNGSKEMLLESFKVLLSFICTIHKNGYVF